MNGFIPEIGIMQGRLAPPEGGRFQSFPRAAWREEFTRAAEAGIGCIEWIHDHYGEDVNPLLSDAGQAEMRRLIGATGVKVVSLCADWFMEAPLVRASGAELAERLAHLRRIIGRCKAIGIGRITLPFVDASRIEGPADVRAVIAAIGAALPAAEAAGVELHLETSLGPAEFAALLGQLDHPLVKANYDSGNSSSLDYNVAEEFAAYGHRIGSIHVKDRVKGGGTVPLGTGNANLPVFFDCLKTIGFRRELILQVARGTPGEETSWIRQTRLAVLEMWNRAKAGAGDPSAVAAAAGSATLEGAGANSATGKESSIETGRAAR